jgi:hypothetical protein
MDAGRLGMHLGESDVNRLLGFITGYHACQVAHGHEDTEYERFREWLRDVKNEFPTEGWVAKYLRDCGGNHERAIRKYLDFAAEFVALRKK